MAYGQKYFSLFQNVDGCRVGVTIFEKDWGGSVVEILASGSQPVIIDYKSGDLYANDPIRGSVLTFKYINTGAVPITIFSSEDDTKYFATVSMAKPAGLLSEIWRGFLSQDDCTDDLIDTPLEVILTFTDGLGQLKNQYFTDLAGDLITGMISLKSVFYYIIFGKIGLGLPVKIFCNLFENSMSDRSDDPAFEPFAQTFIDASTFLLTSQTVQDFASGPNAQIVQLKDKVQDCYTIMQNILDAWGCTIVQANGYWVIVRWFELKQFNNLIPGTRYNANFTNATAITFDNIKVISHPDPSAAINTIYQPVVSIPFRQLFRGNQYTRLTYNYKLPYNLLLNEDLSHIGTLIDTFTTGTGVNLITTKDYVFNDWIISPENSIVPYPLETFIRIEFNYLGVEMRRFAVVRKGVIGQSIWATPFKINQFDKGNLSFGIATNNNTAPGTSVFNIKIFPPGTTNFTIAGGVPFYGLKVDTLGNPYWAFNSSGYAYYHNDLIDPGTSVSIDMPSFPIDGLMLITLPTVTTDGSGTSATYYKNIHFTGYFYIDGNLQVTGQYNESRQAHPVKKNIDKLIYFDDSPKNNIQGAMFLTDGYTKTTSWHRWPLVEDRAFGWVQSVDWEYLTNVIRSKVSGNYKGLVDATSIFMSALSIIQFDMIANGNFIFGQCSFDLKNAQFNGTVQEAYNTGEYAPGYDFAGTEFTNIFQYLYVNFR